MHSECYGVSVWNIHVIKYFIVIFQSGKMKNNNKKKKPTAIHHHDKPLAELWVCPYLNHD